MMRSLWTSASGMVSQQMNVDNISNNLANVNTTGFKKEKMEFKSLLYETMQKAALDENGAGRPVGLQIGHGVRPIATVKSYAQGNMQMTNNPLDVAIDGNGFFAVQGPNEDEVYTRDGSFKESIVDGESMLVPSDGYPILSTDDEPIVLGEEVNITNLLISEDGKLSYINSDKENEDLGFQLKIVQFSNRAGLENVGQNFLKQTSASGEPLFEVDGDVNQKSRLVQRSLEGSNVQVVEEMVNLIVAQRAYEINSKGIQTSDAMLQEANQLKR
jgi:flagellar basal-body rod protein FlgG